MLSISMDYRKDKIGRYSPVPGAEEFLDASRLYPQVVDKPLSHNSVGMGVDYETIDEVKAMAKRLNAGLRNSREHQKLS